MTWWKWFTIASAILFLIIIITAITVSVQKEKAKKAEDKKKKEEEEEKKKKEQEKQKKEAEEKKNKEENKKTETPPPKQEDHSPTPKFDIKQFLKNLKLKEKKTPDAKQTMELPIKPILTVTTVESKNKLMAATEKNKTPSQFPDVVISPKIPTPNPSPTPPLPPQPDLNPVQPPQQQQQQQPPQQQQQQQQPPNITLSYDLKPSQNKLKTLGNLAKNPALLSQVQSVGDMKIGKGLKCPPNVVLTDAGHSGLNFGGSGLNQALREMYGLSTTELANPDNKSNWDFITPDMDAYKIKEEKDKRKFGKAKSCFCEIFNIDYKGNKNKLIYLVGPDYPDDKTNFANDLKLVLDKYAEKVEEIGKPPANNATVFHGVSNNLFAGDFKNATFSIAGSNFNIIDLAEFLYLNEEIRNKPNAKLIFAGAISAANQACEANLDAVKTAFQNIQATKPDIYNAIENAFHITEKLNFYQTCNILSNIDTDPPQYGLDEANDVELDASPDL